MNFKELCAPSKLYFVIAVLFMVISFFMGTRLYNIFFGILFTLFWSWVLTLLCKWGFSVLAWIIVLFPFLIIGIVMLVIYFTPVKKDVDKKK